MSLAAVDLLASRRACGASTSDPGGRRRIVCSGPSRVNGTDECLFRERNHGGNRGASIRLDSRQLPAGRAFVASSTKARPGAVCSGGHRSAFGEVRNTAPSGARTAAYQTPIKRGEACRALFDNGARLGARIGGFSGRRGAQWARGLELKSETRSVVKNYRGLDGLLNAPVFDRGARGRQRCTGPVEFARRPSESPKNRGTRFGMRQNVQVPSSARIDRP